MARRDNQLRIADSPPTDDAVAYPEPDGFLPQVGANLRRLRVRRGLSLERLARQAGVSRGMLGQIELGQSAPTISLLWKVACALGVTFSALVSPGPGPAVLRQQTARRLSSRDGGFVSRALFPLDEPRRVEFYELHLRKGTTETAEPHPPGTTENLVVAAGAVEITVDGRSQLLAAGDAILFRADVTHSYRNRGTEDAVMYLVMNYGQAGGDALGNEGH